MQLCSESSPCFSQVQPSRSPLSSAHFRNTPFLYGASVLLVAKEFYGKGACVLMNRNPGVHNSWYVVLRIETLLILTTERKCAFILSVFHWQNPVFYLNSCVILNYINKRTSLQPLSQNSLLCSSVTVQQVCPSLRLLQKSLSQWFCFQCGRCSNSGIPIFTLKSAQGKFKLMHMEKRSLCLSEKIDPPAWMFDQ